MSSQLACAHSVPSGPRHSSSASTTVWLPPTTQPSDLSDACTMAHSGAHAETAQVGAQARAA